MFLNNSSPTRQKRQSAAAGLSGDEIMSAEALSPDWDMDMDIEGDDNKSDESMQGSHMGNSSVSSSIYRTIIENGRRYQTLREGEYWGPADDKQFEAMEKGHLVHLVLDCNEENPLFRSPIGENVQHILDIGTGEANWAIDVADRYPDATVRGIDLFPAPQRWTPPNCALEVDDVLKPWVWTQKFDLVHLRWMLGSFTPEEWSGLYKQVYENLIPGGWIEQVEPGLVNMCDDETMPRDSKQAIWGDMFYSIGNKISKPLNTFDTLKGQISAAGFINIHEHTYKVPIGPWPKHPAYKEVGRLNLEQQLTGIEGYATFLLTRFGAPNPWTAEQVSSFLRGMEEELMDPRRHTYTFTKRVWAQKPFDMDSIEALTANLDISSDRYTEQWQCG